MAESTAERAASKQPQLKVAANGGAAIGGAAVMFVLAAETRSVWLQVVGCALVGLLGASSLCLARKHPLTLSLVWPSKASVGDTVEFTCRVSNVSGRPTRPVRVSIFSCAKTPLFAPLLMYFDPLTSRGYKRAAAKRELGVRGATDHLHATVDVVAPFGFFVLRSIHAFRDQLHVAPSPVRPIDLPDLIGSHSDANGVVGRALEVRGVREWRPGDPARHVHWRSTARTGRLTVFEYGEPSIGGLGVLVGGTVGDPQFEGAVALVAATAQPLAEAGVPVFASVDNSDASHIELVTPQSWHSCFAAIGSGGVIGPPATVDGLFEAVGSGGIVLVGLGAGVPAGWTGYVESAAAAAGVQLVVLTERAAGADQ